MINPAKMQKSERLDVGGQWQQNVMENLRNLGAVVVCNDYNGITPNKGDFQIVSFPDLPDFEGRYFECKVCPTYSDSKFFCPYERSRKGSYGQNAYAGGIGTSKADYWIIYKRNDAYIIATKSLRSLWEKSTQEKNSKRPQNDAPDKGRMVEIAPYRRTYFDFEIGKI